MYKHINFYTILKSLTDQSVYPFSHFRLYLYINVLPFSNPKLYSVARPASLKRIAFEKDLIMQSLRVVIRFVIIGCYLVAAQKKM